MTRPDPRRAVERHTGDAEPAGAGSALPGWVENLPGKTVVRVVERTVEITVPSGPAHVAGRIVPDLPSVPLIAGPPVLVVMVDRYNGNSREQAAADVFEDWSRAYPGHLIRVVHADDAPGWEPASSALPAGRWSR